MEQVRGETVFSTRAQHSGDAASRSRSSWTLQTLQEYCRCDHGVGFRHETTGFAAALVYGEIAWAVLSVQRPSDDAAAARSGSQGCGSFIWHHEVRVSHWMTLPSPDKSPTRTCRRLSGRSVACTTGHDIVVIIASRANGRIWEIAVSGSVLRYEMQSSSRVFRSNFSPSS